MFEEGEDGRKAAVLVYDGRAGAHPPLRLLAHIQETSPQTVTDLAQSYGGKKRTIERHLKELRSEGLLLQRGLEITDKGRSALSDLDEDELNSVE
jgi:DNA-binding transcriptional ArsR family regulator